MKIYAFSTFNFFIITLCFLNSYLAERVIPEYHIDSKLVHTENGCKHIHNHNGTITLHYTKIDEKRRHVKRNRTPLTKPFEPTFICEVGTEANCNKLKKAMNYANKIFSSIFDFYVPIKITIEIQDEEVKNYHAHTNSPVYYSLKHPNEVNNYSYPISLVKQLLTDEPIKFNEINNYDIYTVFDVSSLGDDCYIEPTLIHEILHGLGFYSQLKPIKGGYLGENIPVYGNNYYLTNLFMVDDEASSKTTIKGFVPPNVWEKNFVDPKNPNSYYIDDSFVSIGDIKMNYEMHEPVYLIEKNNLKNFPNDLEKWEGMNTSIEFYEKSHHSNSVAFKTKDNSLLYLCTFDNGDDPDLSHVGNEFFTYKSKYNVEYNNHIDENFLFYPENINIHLSNEEKIKRFGNGKTIGVIGYGLINALETLGYHRKGTPEDTTVYHVQTHEVLNSGHVIDGHNDDSGIIISNGSVEDNHKNNTSGAFLRSASSSFLYVISFSILCKILFSFF